MSENNSLLLLVIFYRASIYNSCTIRNNFKNIGILRMVLSFFIPRIVFHTCVLVLIIHVRNFTECNIPFTEKTEIK